MPDQNGILNPQDIANQGVDALLKLYQLKQQDEANSRAAQLFQQQLKSGELELKIKQEEFNFQQAKKAILGLNDIDPKTGQPKKQPTSADFALAERYGFIPKATPLELLPPGKQGAAAEVATGLVPEANTSLQAGVAMRGQDITQGTAANQLAQSKAEFRASFVESLRANGANLNLIGDDDPTDPKIIARVTNGMEPIARMNARASLISARAQALHALAADDLARAEAMRYSADAKNKFAVLKIANDSFGKFSTAYSAAVNYGADDAVKETLFNQMVQAASVVSQSYKAVGLELPPAAEPKPGFWEGVKKYLGFGTKKTATGPIDMDKFNKAMAEGNLDANIGASPAPGASPQTATPTPQNPPAAGAPTSFEPGTVTTDPQGRDFDEEGFPFAREFAPGSTGAAAAAVPAGGAAAPPAAPSPALPLTSGEVNRGSTASFEAGKKERRTALLKQVQLYMTSPSMYATLVNDLSKLPIDEQLTRLEAGLKVLRARTPRSFGLR